MATRDLHPGLDWALGGFTAVLVSAMALLPSAAYVHIHHLNLLGTSVTTAAPFARTAARRSVDIAASPPARVVHWQDVQPIFAAHCVGCHSNLSTYARALHVGAIPAGGLLAGARVITAGDPAGSLLVQALIGKQPIGEAMPYRAGSLSKSDIHMIEEWIRTGAHL